MALRRLTLKKVMCDASKYDLGGVLLQRNEDGLLSSVSFTSAQLRKDELAYAAHEKECLAVVDGHKKWLPYHHGEKFKVLTDRMS